MLDWYKKSAYTSFIAIVFFALAVSARAQSGGSSGSISGTVSDPDGAVVPDATVEIHNPVSHFTDPLRRTNPEILAS